jgi:2-haloacid dehalogenase
MLRLVILDVNGTLFSLDPIADRLAAVGLPGRLEVWFARILRDGIAAAAAGTLAPFPDLGRHHLEVLLDEAGIAPTDTAVASVLGGFEAVTAHEDVGPALQVLADAGVPTVTMTNGSSAITQDFLDRAGLRPLVAATYDVSMAGRWKPAPEAYRYVLRQQTVAPHEAALVAVHPWDLHGAASAGLSTGWVDRHGDRYPDVFAPPDVRGRSMEMVVQRLLQRGR